jgi:hypothetical protein
VLSSSLSAQLLRLHANNTMREKNTADFRRKMAAGLTKRLKFTII